MTTLTSSNLDTEQRPRSLVWAGVAIVLTAINLRTAVTGFSPLFETVAEDLGFGLFVIGLLGTIPAAAFGVFGFLAPVVTRRFGLEPTAAAALALTAVSLLLRALSAGTIVLVLSTVSALAGIGAANVVIVPLVKAWFPDRIALWTSAYLILLQTGQFVAPLLAVPVADAAGWRVSVGVWAVPAALATLVWFALATRMRASHRVVAQAGPPAEAGSASPRPRVGASPLVWGLMLLMAMIALSNYAIVTWLPAVLTDAGGSHTLGGTMVALYSAWGVAAALTVPHLTARMTNPFPVVVAFTVVLVIGYLGLIYAPMNGTAIWVCALGIGVSNFPLCLTLINLRTRSAQTASVVSGFVQGLGYALACLGPIGLGVLRQAAGSWTLPLWLLVGTTIPTLIAGWLASRPRFVEDD